MSDIRRGIVLSAMQRKRHRRASQGCGLPSRQAILARTASRQDVYASIWRRFCAALFDAVLASAILFPATVLLVWVMEAYHSEIGLSEYKSRTAVGTAAVLLWIVCFGLYCASAESSVHQATPGKRLLKLKVASIVSWPAQFPAGNLAFLRKVPLDVCLVGGFCYRYLPFAEAKFARYHRRHRRRALRLKPASSTSPKPRFRSSQGAEKVISM